LASDQERVEKRTRDASSQERWFLDLEERLQQQKADLAAREEELENASRN